jgi:hypothetical protein
MPPPTDRTEVVFALGVGALPVVLSGPARSTVLGERHSLEVPFTNGYAPVPRERINARIELIDRARLAELMLRHGVGVQTEVTVTLHQLNEDFFESL